MPRPAVRRGLVAVIALVASGSVIAVALLAGAARTPPAAPVGSSGGAPIRIGAVFPLAGNAAGPAGEELAGVRIAADLVNADGGVGGRPIELVVRDLESRADAPGVMAALRADGVSVVVGAYSSDLSIAASSAADAAGLVYWEAGAVADRLTGRGLPLVFRVGASGTELGTNSARFAATELAPRLGVAAPDLRIAIVNAQDDYARSVADAAERTAGDAHERVVARLSYDLGSPAWPRLMDELKAASPDVLILASHIPDGVAFRRAMLSAGLRVKAFIGSTMAECDPDFAGDLGADVIGIFASDRPTGGFQPGALDPAARAVYDRFAADWAMRPGAASPAPGGITQGGGLYGNAPGPSALSEYELVGPDLEVSTGPTEEGISGFAAAWPLFHDVLPAATRAGSLDASAIAAAARAIDLPTGALPNGAGLRFSSDPATLGQNERAAAVIWQWQAARTYAFVWPPTYATGTIEFVPLPR